MSENSNKDVTSAARALQVLGSVVAPSTLVTALLYFFGQVRTDAYYAYFGIDRSVLRLSTQDYLVRAPELALLPLVLVLLLTALLWTVRRRLDGWLRRTKSRRPAAVVAIAVQVTTGVLLAIGVTGLIAPLWITQWALPPLASALLLGSGAVLGIAGFRPTNAPGLSAASNGSAANLWVVRICLIGTAILAAFWAESLYANQAGVRLAEYTVSTPSSQPAAVIYSRDRLQISGPGVQVVSLSGTDSAYQFRYSGLRLLIFANTRWFLIPDGWATNNGATAIVLPDSDTLRVDFQP